MGKLGFEIIKGLGVFSRYIISCGKKTMREYSKPQKESHFIFKFVYNATTILLGLTLFFIIVYFLF